MTRTYTVYRAYDADDVLLYVGMSFSPLMRLGQHDVRSEWADLTAKVTFERHQTKTEAEDAERRAIFGEQPKFNNYLKTASGPVLPRSAAAKSAGQVIRGLRLAHGVGQSALALSVGIDKTHLSRIERGVSGCSEEILQRIADTLRVPVDMITATDDFVVTVKVDAPGINGEAIRAIREAQAWGLCQFARHAGVDQAVLSKLERGKRQRVRPVTAQRIAAGLGVPVEAIMRTEDAA